MTGTYIRSTFITDQTEFIEHLQNGKQIGELLDMQKRPQAQTDIFFAWGGGKYHFINSTFRIAFTKKA